jgi:hypothetical protein
MRAVTIGIVAYETLIDFERIKILRRSEIGVERYQVNASDVFAIGHDDNHWFMYNS